jgi:hypothetical protein
LLQAGLGIIQSVIWRLFQVETQWGIWDSSGKSLGDPSIFTGLIGNAIEAVGFGSTLSTGSVEYAKETRVSDFPVEGGAFATYNKVETPATPTVTLYLAGSESARTSFLNEIDKAVKSTDMYSVVTPEVIYINYTVERYSYSRKHDRGAYLLAVDISLKEVRAVSAQYTQSNKTETSDAPKSDSATPSVDTGKVQPAPPDVSTLKSIANSLPDFAAKANDVIMGALKP